MSRRKRPHRHLQVVPNPDTSAVGTGAAPTGAAPTGAAPTGAAHTGAAPTGAAPTGAARTGAAPTGAAPAGAARAGASGDGRRNKRRRKPDRGLPPMDELDLMAAFDPGDDVPPLARMGIMQEMAAMSRAADGLPIDDILDQLEDLGMPPDLVEEGRTLGDEHRAELAGLLTAATAMLTGDPVTGLLGVWAPLLDRKMTAFDAELVTAEILWAFGGASADDDLVDGLSRLIEEAEHTGRPEALVMCRMLAHLGPSQVRDRAAQSADTLARGGLRDRPWVSSLGTATFHRAYGCTDGGDRILGLEFAYGRRRHAFAFLLDEHDGTVVGLLASDDADETYRQVRLEASVHGLTPNRIGAEEAAGLIRSALARPFRPEDGDDEGQMECIVPVVLERLGHLPSGDEHDDRVPRSVVDDRPALAVRDLGVAGIPAVVHRIKVTLTGSKPPVWRRLEVPSDLSLTSLHEVLRTAFGRRDGHAWRFTAAGQVYGVGDIGVPRDIGVPHRDARRVTIGEIAPTKGATVEYLHDRGDGWAHRIRVEEVGAADPDATYPRCLTGRPAAPRDAAPERVGDQDPGPFDVDECNDRLAAFAARRPR